MFTARKNDYMKSSKSTWYTKIAKSKFNAKTLKTIASNAFQNDYKLYRISITFQIIHIIDALTIIMCQKRAEMIRWLCFTMFIFYWNLTLISTSKFVRRLNLLFICTNMCLKIRISSTSKLSLRKKLIVLFMQIIRFRSLTNVLHITKTNKSIFVKRHKEF